MLEELGRKILSITKKKMNRKASFSNSGLLALGKAIKQLMVRLTIAYLTKCSPSLSMKIVQSRNHE